jgi:hypothetical protein
MIDEKQSRLLEATPWIIPRLPPARCKLPKAHAQAAALVSISAGRLTPT